MPQIGFKDQLSLNASLKFCRMLQGEHSAPFSTFTKLPLVIKIFVLSIFESFTQGFTVCCNRFQNVNSIGNDKTAQIQLACVFVVE